MENNMEQCPCGSEKSYSECCETLISGSRKALTAEELMRSRYTAYTKVEVNYIGNTMHPDKRKEHDENSVREWAENSEWLGLEILETTAGGRDDNEGSVEFIADYILNDKKEKHHELASFKKTDGEWFFYDGQAPTPKQVIRKGPKVGRNDPCPCGSGKKYKKCCGN